MRELPNGRRVKARQNLLPNRKTFFGPARALGHDSHKVHYFLAPHPSVGGVSAINRAKSACNERRGAFQLIAGLTVGAFDSV